MASSSSTRTTEKPVEGTSSGWSLPEASNCLEGLDGPERRSLEEAGCSALLDLAGFTLGELEDLVGAGPSEALIALRLTALREVDRMIAAPLEGRARDVIPGPSRTATTQPHPQVSPEAANPVGGSGVVWRPAAQAARQPAGKIMIIKIILRRFP